MTPTNQMIVPHLWFDREAAEATEFYTSLFPDSRITGKTTITNTPSGQVDIITFNLWGGGFMAINAGPLFRFNPAVSFFVYCGAGNTIDRLYKELSMGGTAIMPLDKYPWSDRYAWVQDRFGLTWQLDIDDIHAPQKILPTLLFVNEKHTRVKEAVSFYTAVFPGSKVILEAPYDKSAGVPEGTLLFAQYKLNGYLINSMSSTLKHDYDFNESVSLMVYCNNQEEMDYYWEKLTFEGQEQPCGWVKDKFGVSWQVVPAAMDEMMRTKNKEQLRRLTEAMLQMVKLDLEKLQQAFYNK